MSRDRLPPALLAQADAEEEALIFALRNEEAEPISGRLADYMPSVRDSCLSGWTLEDPLRTALSLALMHCRHVPFLLKFAKEIRRDLTYFLCCPFPKDCPLLASPVSLHFFDGKQFDKHLAAFFLRAALGQKNFGHAATLLAHFEKVDDMVTKMPDVLDMVFEGDEDGDEHNNYEAYCPLALEDAKALQGALVAHDSPTAKALLRDFVFAQGCDKPPRHLWVEDLYPDPEDVSFTANCFWRSGCWPGYEEVLLRDSFHALEGLLRGVLKGEALAAEKATAFIAWRDKYPKPTALFCRK